VTSSLLKLIESDEFVEAVSRRAGGPAATTLANVASEARLGLDLLSRAPVGPLRPGQRVLEIGAGSGLLASILREQGIDVMAVEPLIAGFTVLRPSPPSKSARPRSSIRPAMDSSTGSSRST
jgi:hypothetical protein